MFKKIKLLWRLSKVKFEHECKLKSIKHEIVLYDKRFDWVKRINNEIHKINSTIKAMNKIIRI